MKRFSLLVLILFACSLGQVYAADEAWEGTYIYELEGSRSVAAAFTEARNEMVADFGGAGLLYMNSSGTWSSLSSSNPECIIEFNTNLIAADFGTNGLQQYNGTTWTNFPGGYDLDNTGNTMAAYGSGILADRGASGLWQYTNSVPAGSWNQLSATDPEYFTVFNTNCIAADFGTQGVWQYCGATWTQITSADVDNSDGINTTPMVAHKNGVVMDFGTNGPWYLDNPVPAGNYTRLTTTDGLDAENMADFSAGHVAMDFNTRGVWQIDTTTRQWLRLTSPGVVMDTNSGMLSFGYGLVMDFGTRGLWWTTNRKPTGLWQRVSALHSDYTVTANTTFLEIDFGSHGLWEFDTTGLPGNYAAWSAAWTQPKLSSMDADNTGNAMIVIDFTP